MDEFLTTARPLTRADIEAAIEKMRADTSQPEHRHITWPGGMVCAECGADLRSDP